MNRRVSPGLVQAGIWIGAAAIVGIVSLVAFGLNRPSVTPSPPPGAARTQAAPTEADEAPTEDSRAAPSAPRDTGEVGPPPTMPDSRLSTVPPPPPPGVPPPPATPPAVPRTEITEAEFIEVSAHMVLARDHFTDTAEGRELLAQACDSILRDRNIDREAFERYSQALAESDGKAERVGREILRRADQLRVSSVRIEARPAIPPR